MDNKANKKLRLASIFDPRWWFYDVGKVLIWPSFALLLRTKKVYISKQAKKDARGNSIIVANHSSMMDVPVLLHGFFSKRLRCLATKDLQVKIKWFGTLLKMCRCIFVDKENFSMSCMKEMTDTLARGETVVIFPEGSVNGEDSVMPFKEGVVFVALKSGAKVLPVYIESDNKVYHRKKLFIGEAIRLSSDKPMPTMKDVKDMAARLEAAVNELKEYKTEYNSNGGTK